MTYIFAISEMSPNRGFNKFNRYNHYKVWDEITYPFLNFNGCTVDV